MGARYKSPGADVPTQAGVSKKQAAKKKERAIGFVVIRYSRAGRAQQTPTIQVFWVPHILLAATQNLPSIKTETA